MALDPLPRPWRLAFLGFGAAWCVLAFVHLYLFALPWMDSWCYLAPAAVDARPLRLTTPFLGSFAGLDHAWGLQWPGVPLVNSVVFSLFPFHPAVLVAWDVLLWLGAAAALAGLAWKTARSPFLSFGVFGLVLFDRAFFFVAYAHRMELMGVIALAPLVWLLIERANGREPTRLVLGLARVAVFAAPLLHAAAMAFAGAAVTLMLWRGWSRRAWQGPALEAALFLGGCAALATWFLLQPPALEQFVQHARQAAAVSTRGQVFLIAIPLFYAPTYTGLLPYALGMGTAVAGVLGRWKRAASAAGESRVLVDLGLLALAIFVALNLLHNPDYILLLLPALAPLGAFGLKSLAARPAIRRVPAWVLGVAGAGFLILHGAFWATRTLSFLQAGRPNLREELAGFWSTLPAEGRLWVPESLWEEAARTPERRARTRMNTLPHAADPARRDAYEAETYAAARPGDILVLDRYQGMPMRLDPATHGWEKIREVTRPLPGRRGAWGYDFVVYRRRD